MFQEQQSIEYYIRINLKGLIDNEIINQEVEVRGPKNEIIGNIYVKVKIK